VPKHIKSSCSIEEFTAFLNALKADPIIHTTLTPDLILDPEVIFFIDYLADEQGWAHSMQIHPDGYAHYIRHQPSELNKGVRWITRTPDQEALGLYLPATAEHEGYLKEKEKGNIKILPAGETTVFHLEAGLLHPDAAREMEKNIGKILS
jgi:hypothetical protein